MAQQDAKKLLAALKNPFDPRLVKWTNKGGKSPNALAYIDARDVMKRLDDVLGAENYQTKYKEVAGGMICELSLRINGEWLTRSDGASFTKIEPVKGGVSDALKRAGNAWGIGRYLYYLNPKKFNQGNVDSWPKWALPGQVEDWEAQAEAEADASFGMDEEGALEAGIDLAMELAEITELDKLGAFEKKLDETSRRLLADKIANKADEITRNNG